MVVCKPHLCVNFIHRHLKCFNKLGDSNAIQMRFKCNSEEIQINCVSNTSVIKLHLCVNIIHQHLKGFIKLGVVIVVDSTGAQYTALAQLQTAQHSMAHKNHGTFSAKSLVSQAVAVSQSAIGSLPQSQPIRLRVHCSSSGRLSDSARPTWLHLSLTVNSATSALVILP